jgi:hypothetical protein
LSGLYEMEVDMEADGVRAPANQPKVALEEEAAKEAHAGGNLMDMKYCRMKVKTLSLEDNELLQALLSENFNLSLSLPLPDIYYKTVSR